MSTEIRPELSNKNQYHIGKHRYYELMHHCLQYKEWKKEAAELTDDLMRSKSVIETGDSTKDFRSDTEEKAMKLARLNSNMKLIEQLTLAVDPSIAWFLFKGVTEHITYSTLSTLFEMPAGRDYYYNCYRHFFWLLDKQLK